MKQHFLYLNYPKVVNFNYPTTLVDLWGTGFVCGGLFGYSCFYSHAL